MVSFIMRSVAVAIVLLFLLVGIVRCQKAYAQDVIAYEELQ